MNRRLLLALMGTLSIAGGAVAQTPAPARIRATIDKLDGTTLSLTTRANAKVTVVLTDDAKVVAASKAQVGDIKPGSYIGSAAVPQPDGSLKALEVTVFPPSMNGTGEGSYGWDLTPASTMTNGTVGDLVVSEGRTMTVKYGSGGEKKIVVPDDVPIVSLAPSDRTLLVPGAHVVIAAAKAADGALTASRVTVGANGTVPPM